MSRHRRGAAAIEFIMWFPILALLISGLIDIGWYMSSYHRVQRVAQDAARFGVRQAANETTSNEGDLQEAAALSRGTTMLGTLGLSGSVTPLYIANGACPFDRLQVSVSANFFPLVGLVALPSTIETEFHMASEIQR